MRLPSTAHTDQPWRIHELAPDFELEDVWALPTPGGPDDLPRLVGWFAAGDPELSRGVVGTLMAVRRALGALLAWDRPATGVGARVPSLRERLPPDLRDGPRGPDPRAVQFTSVFQTDREYVAELANETVQALLHLGWVADPSGGYRGQLAVLVRPNGITGRAYMAAIKPIRRTLVYPALLRTLGRAWPRCT